MEDATYGSQSGDRTGILSLLMKNKLLATDKLMEHVFFMNEFLTTHWPANQATQCGGWWILQEVGLGELQGITQDEAASTFFLQL